MRKTYNANQSFWLVCCSAKFIQFKSVCLSAKFLVVR